MKVLIVFDVQKETDNLFVSTLCQTIYQQGVDIHCSLLDFWEDNSTQYNIIHFQWPEEVVGWTCTKYSVIHQLKERFEYFKAQGCRFVYTRHNERPHYQNEIIEKAYHLIESYSNIVVHMGTYSSYTFAQEYPNKKNIIIPHHIYQHVYSETLSRKEARTYLRLPQNGFIVTAFGKFRNKEEIAMTLKGFASFKCNHKFLVAPRLLPFSRNPRYHNPIKRLLSLAGYFLVPCFLRIKHIYAGMSDQLIDNDILPYYLAASDVILIQRKQILNSGNVPLAFQFGKVVVGPAIGNIKEWLQSTGNPLFNPNDILSIGNALNKARQLVAKDKGKENYQYACKKMNQERVAKMYIEAYIEAMKEI